MPYKNVNWPIFNLNRDVAVWHLTFMSFHDDCDNNGIDDNDNTDDDKKYDHNDGDDGDNNDCDDDDNDGDDYSSVGITSHFYDDDKVLYLFQSESFNNNNAQRTNQSLWNRFPIWPMSLRFRSPTVPGIWGKLFSFGTSLRCVILGSNGKSFV